MAGSTIPRLKVVDATGQALGLEVGGSQAGAVLLVEMVCKSGLDSAISAGLGS
jgi:hypothetical protein